jgi:hypothetical protein
LEPPVCTDPPPPAHDTKGALLLARWTLAARVACVVAVAPIAVLSSTEDSVVTAAQMHLLTMPVTSYVLQRYNHMRYAMGPQCVMAFACMLLANTFAVLQLLSSSPTPAAAGAQPSNCSCCRPSNPSASGSNSDRRLHALLALVLILGAAQMLWVTQKRVMTRVMLCTATSMLVMALAIVGALTPPYMGRLFFQSAALPLLLLFMESSSPAPPRGAPEHC